MVEWLAFVAARDRGALALWGFGVALALLVAALPARWRGWAVVLIAVYAVGTAAWMP